MAVVLVIDDSKLARSGIRKILAPAGHEVLEAEGVQEGLELISRHSPDCILTDILMPEITGMDFLARLRSEGCQTPVIVTTADIQESVRDKCLEMGAFAVVHKPLLLKNILETVEEALKGKEK